MFQTIGTKHGFVQLNYCGHYEKIEAYSHGQYLGGHFKTIAGAKRAITAYHKKWLAENFSKPAYHYLGK